MSEQAARFVGSIPDQYDRNLGPVIFAEFATDLARRIADLGAASVLELAAGTGIVTRCLRDALPAASTLLATDLNPPMLAVAQQKFRDDEKVNFQQADATDLPFDDRCFEAVACQFGVMFFPDKERSYREVRRVLQPGGHYCFSVWDCWEHNRFAQLAHETVAGFFADNPPGFYKVPFGYADPAPISEALVASGFSSVKAEVVDVVSRISSIQNFATGLVFGNPLHEEILARDGNPREVCDALAAALQESLGSSIALRATVFTAKKD